MLSRKKKFSRKKIERYLQKQKECESLSKNQEKHKKYLKKNNIAQKKQRNALKQTNITNGTNTIKFNFPALSRSIRKAKRSLPKNNEQKRFGIKSLFQETINCSPRKMRLISIWTNIRNIPRKKGRPSMLNDEIKEKLDIFLSDNTVLPYQATITKFLSVKMSMEKVFLSQKKKCLMNI